VATETTRLLHDAPMPVLIELHLKATRPMHPDTKQLHGLACALFESENSDHRGQQKPFSAGPLIPASTESAHDWKWRAAWLRDELPPASALAPEQIRVGHVTCTVTEARHRAISHTQLAADPHPQVVTVEFRSPTYFSHNNSTVVTPDPRLIVGSWQRRWNASLPAGHPLSISDTSWQRTQRDIRLSEFDLRTERHDSGRDSRRTGFTGWATLRTTGKASAEAQALLGTLARFAEFSGTGAQTTHGFGATALASPHREAKNVAT
jgi:CRISPR-associated endoribonuclease Cas6